MIAMCTSLSVVAATRSTAEASAGAVREQFVEGDLRVFKRFVLHELVVVALPGPVATQPFDVYIPRSRAVFKRDCALKQVRVILPQGLYLLLFHGRTEKTRAFSRLRQPGPLDHAHALLACPSPFIERIMFFVLFVRFVDWCGVLDAPRLPGIVADVFLDALAAGHASLHG